VKERIKGEELTNKHLVKAMENVNPCAFFDFVRVFGTFYSSRAECSMKSIMEDKIIKDGLKERYNRSDIWKVADLLSFLNIIYYKTEDGEYHNCDINHIPKSSLGASNDSIAIVRRDGYEGLKTAVEMLVLVGINPKDVSSKKGCD
jgi:hypothetical protein